MLDKPDIQDNIIADCIKDEYKFRVKQIDFLPIGADLSAAVYKAVDENETTYFIKLKRNPIDEISVTLPKYLKDQGIIQIIEPIPTRSGELWVNLNDFKMILYPFVEGKNGYETNLSERNWCEFGLALKRIHACKVPFKLSKFICREIYSPKWRKKVIYFLVQITNRSLEKSIEKKSAELILDKKEIILDLVRRADIHAKTLLEHPAEFVLCHSDIHAGNILIGTNESIFIVDWDNPIMALKERDLMSIGGGLFGSWRTSQEEENLFYHCYGPTQVDPVALAYYRYERIIQDIAVECEQIFLSKGGMDDCEQTFQYLKSNFLPHNTIEIAYKSDKILRIG